MVRTPQYWGHYGNSHQKAVTPSSLNINLMASVRLRYLEENENWREKEYEVNS